MTTTKIKRRTTGAGIVATQGAGQCDAQARAVGAATKTTNNATSNGETQPTKAGLPVSPSMADGFNGARDASILERYAEMLTEPEKVAAGIVYVQCVERTKNLLHRAGYRRTFMHQTYEVRVVKDWMDRLQLAPPPRDEDEVAVKALAKKMDGRRPRLQRTTMTAAWKVTKVRWERGAKGQPFANAARLLRDPRDVAFRYLCRFVGGYWFRGGSHVARLNYGPGLGFPKFRNDRCAPITAITLNLSAGGVA